MSPSNSNNRLVQVTFDKKMGVAIRKFLAGIASLPVGSQVMTPEHIAEVFDSRVAASEAVEAAAAAHTAAVKANRDKRSQTAPLVRAARRVIIGMFAESPDTLAEFGLSAPKKAAKTVATKATAIAKNKATRVARHTMGPKQKAEVKGATPTTPSSPSATPAQPVSTTPSATAPASVAPGTTAPAVTSPGAPQAQPSPGGASAPAPSASGPSSPAPATKSAL